MVMAPIGAPSASVRPLGAYDRLSAWHAAAQHPAPGPASWGVDLFQPRPQAPGAYAPLLPPGGPGPAWASPGAPSPAGLGPQGLAGRLFGWLRQLFQGPAAPAPQPQWPQPGPVAPQPQWPQPGTVAPQPQWPQPGPVAPQPAPSPSRYGTPLKASFVQAYASTTSGMSNAQVRAANEAASRASADNVDKDLFAAIDAVPAGGRIDGALFDIEDAGMVETLIRAKQRGVEVRLTTEADYYFKSDKQTLREPIQRLLAAGIPIRPDDRGGLMHDKFLVLDGQKVWTGSTNVTENGLYQENNNALLIESSELAAQYSAEFARMFERGNFGPNEPSDPHPAPRTVQVGSARITTYFSPGRADAQSAQQAILNVVSSARQSVEFMSFSFTDDQLGATMIELARRGVKVEGVFEKSQAASRYSEYQTMKQAMPSVNAGGATRLDVRTDANPALMHHKVIIVDGSTLIMGSHNFSESAQSDNNENLLVIENAPDLVAQYQAEFRRIQAISNAPGA